MFEDGSKTIITESSLIDSNEAKRSNLLNLNELYKADPGFVDIFLTAETVKHSRIFAQLRFGGFCINVRRSNSRRHQILAGDKFLVKGIKTERGTLKIAGVFLVGTDDDGNESVIAEENLNLALDPEDFTR